MLEDLGKYVFRIACLTVVTFFYDADNNLLFIIFNNVYNDIFGENVITAFADS